MNGLLDQIFNPVYTYTASGGIQTRMDSSLNGNVYIGDSSTNYGIYLNGAAWTASAGVANICGAAGSINLSGGSGITITQPTAGTFVFSGGASAGVTSICGATGLVNLSSGSGITIAQPTAGTFVFTGTGGTNAGVSAIAVGAVSLSGVVTLSGTPGITATNVGNTVVLSNTGVTTVCGAAGSINLSSGSGITIAQPTAGTFVFTGTGGTNAGVSTITVGGVSLSGAVTLAGGSGITLSSTGNTITISAASFSGSLSANLDTNGYYIVDSSVGYSYIPSLATSDFWVGSTYVYETSLAGLNIDNDVHIDGDVTLTGLLNAQIGITDVDTLTVHSNLNVGVNAGDAPYSDSIFNVSGTSYMYTPDVSDATVSTTYFTTTSSLTVPANTGVSFRIWGGGGGNTANTARTFYGGGGAYVDTNVFIPTSPDITVSFIAGAPGGATGGTAGAAGGQLVKVTAGAGTIWVGGGGGAGYIGLHSDGRAVDTAGGAGGANGQPGAGVQPANGHNALGGTLIAGGSGALNVIYNGSNGLSEQGGAGQPGPGGNGGGGGGAGYYGGGGGAGSGGGGGSTYINGGGITGTIYAGSRSNAGNQDYPVGYPNYGNAGYPGLVELKTYTYLSSKALALCTDGPVAINTLTQQGALNVSGTVFCTSLYVAGQPIGGGSGVTSISAAGTEYSGIVGITAGTDISITSNASGFTIASTASGSASGWSSNPAVTNVNMSGNAISNAPYIMLNPTAGNANFLVATAPNSGYAAFLNDGTNLTLTTNESGQTVKTPLVINLCTGAVNMQYPINLGSTTMAAFTSTGNSVIASPANLTICGGLTVYGNTTLGSALTSTTTFVGSATINANKIPTFSSGILVGNGTNPQFLPNVSGLTIVSYQLVGAGGGGGMGTGGGGGGGGAGGYIATGSFLMNTPDEVAVFLGTGGAGGPFSIGGAADGFAGEQSMLYMPYSNMITVTAPGGNGGGHASGGAGSGGSGGMGGGGGSGLSQGNGGSGTAAAPWTTGAAGTSTSGGGGGTPKNGITNNAGGAGSTAGGAGGGVTGGAGGASGDSSTAGSNGLVGTYGGGGGGGGGGNGSVNGNGGNGGNGCLLYTYTNLY